MGSDQEFFDFLLNVEVVQCEVEWLRKQPPPAYKSRTHICALIALAIKNISTFDKKNRRNS